MIGGLERYPAMKDSGGPPVGEIPKHVETPGRQTSWH